MRFTKCIVADLKSNQHQLLSGAVQPDSSVPLSGIYLDLHRYLKIYFATGI